MTLYDYLKLHKEDEIVVTDTDYDTESYWYWYDESNIEENSDEFTTIRLSKLLKVKKVNNWNVVCNISDLIEKHIGKLEESNLFNHCDIDSIMYDFDNIVAGYVSEQWFKKFVDILSSK